MPGTVAPAEGTPDPNKPEELGPNNEKLETVDPTLVAALRELVLSYRMEGMVARRDELRRIKQARLYFRGLQYGSYDPNDMQVHLPFGSVDGSGLAVTDADDGQSPRFQYCTNIYQAYGLAFIAVMSAAIPTPKFYPMSAQNEQDITTAKACDDVRRLIEKNNKVKKLLAEIAFRMWTDSKICAYVRWVADGQRFGFEELPELNEEMAALGEDVYVCPDCGTETPASGDTFGMGATFCATCSAPLSDDDLKPADYVPIPQQVGSKRIPKGQEVISILGGLEVHTPPWADEMPEMPYIQWNMETHIARLKAAYSHAAKKIVASGPTGADDVYARTARLSVKQGLPGTSPGDSLANLVTFSRTWIAPWTFWQIEDEVIRARALEMFPDGCYIAFAGEAYCESRSESFNSCWRIAYGMPGDGQNRPGVGDSIVDIQNQVNDLSNIEQETAEYGIPPILHDSETLDSDAIPNQTSEPATFIPVKVRPTDDIRKKIMQLQPSTVADQFIKRRQELIGPISQFLTGLMPAVWGGELEGNDTAAGYAMAREQALGRIGVFWLTMKVFYASIMQVAIECFRENRTDDVEDVISSEGGDFESKWIHLADLQGHIQTYDDPDENFPELPGQVKAVLQGLLDDPVIGPMLMSEPGNIGRMKDMFGLRDFNVPGEDSRIKQMREISVLLQGAPMPGGMDPMSGMPTPPQSTVPIDPVFDDNKAEAAECKRWANSDAGQTAKQQNPAGFENVVAHFIEHMTAEQQQQGGGAPEKPPSQSLSYKDLTPGGKTQMAAQAGIQLDPAELMLQEQQTQELELKKAEKMKAGGPPAAGDSNV